MLALSAYVIYRMPAPNTQFFEQTAADPSTVSFTNLNRGKVTSLVREEVQQNDYISLVSQTVKAVLLTGSDKHREIEATYDDILTNLALQKIKIGDTIVLGSIETTEGTSYVVVDKYRLPGLGIIAGIFLVLAVIFGRLRGISSIAGLAISIAILLLFIIPNILAGKSPALVTFVGAGLIAFASMFLAHSFTKRAALAVISTLLTLGITQGLSIWFVRLTRLVGNGSEEASFLQQGYLGTINLQGLLLGGIIIGTLGVLNDITISQVSTVEEIHKTDPLLPVRQLYIKGSSVGREHIASLINTLVLAYAGSALPLFLLLVVNTSQPLWAILNSEMIGEEIIRTLVGSIALVLAVPISTLLASAYFTSTPVSAK